MKRNVITAMFSMMILASMLFSALPASAQTGDPLVIGVVCDKGDIIGLQMWAAAEMIRDEVNGMGGVNVDGVNRLIELRYIDEHLNPPRNDLAMAELQAALPDVDLVYGTVYSASYNLIELAKDYAAEYGKPIWFGTSNIDSNGFDCQNGAPAAPCGFCVRCDYDRNKWLFRNNPPNSMLLVLSIAMYYRYGLIPAMARLYGTPVRVELCASSSIDGQFVTRMFAGNGTGTELAPNPGECYVPPDMPEFPKEYWGYSPPDPRSLLGDQCIIVGSAQHSVTETDFDAALDDVQVNKAQVIYIDFDGENGGMFMQQWSERESKAIPAGINVVGMMDEFWDMSGGNAQYGIHIDFLAQNSEMTPYTIPFVQEFTSYTGMSPIYIAYGVYDAFSYVVEALESDIYKEYAATPPGEIDYEVLIPALEMTNKTGIVCTFSYSGPNPSLSASNYPYIDINPTMMGTLHDVAITEFGAEWPSKNFRTIMCQWQGSGQRYAVWPLDQEYSRRLLIPTWIYEKADIDINLDGKINIVDISNVAKFFNKDPGMDSLNMDIDRDGKINIVDITKVAKDFGYIAPQWPLEL